MSWSSVVAQAYLPRHYFAALVPALVLGESIAAGFFRLSRVAAIAIGVAAVAIVDLALRSESAGFRMIAIVSITLVAMKIVTLAFAGPVLLPKQWIAFVAWFGMRPALFTRLGEPSLPGSLRLLTNGLRSIAIGGSMLIVAISVAPYSRTTATIVALPALSLIVHFGFFDVLAAFWRRQGVACDELFRHPLRSRSLSEFWSRRWNVGYSEMIAAVVHRGLRGRVGSRAALMGSFLASGLLHELAISLPVHAGYGLPTAYFLLQGALVGIERRMPRVPGRLWTLFWLIAPLPLLFHGPFIRGVVWPLIGARR